MQLHSRVAVRSERVKERIKREGETLTQRIRGGSRTRDGCVSEEVHRWDEGEREREKEVSLKSARPALRLPDELPA